MRCTEKSEFIGVYDNMLTPEFCAAIIQRFGKSPARTPGRTGHGVDASKKRSTDLSVSLQPDWTAERDALMKAAYAGLRDYLSSYFFALVGSVAVTVADPRTGQPVTITPENWDEAGRPNLDSLINNILRCGLLNMQHYPAGQGHYGYWHHEVYPRDAEAEQLHRVLFFILYLNDVAEGGETEFFYQERAVQPKAGRLLIAPAGFTHTHRGNIPLSGDKYVVTSWTLFQRADVLYAPRGAEGG